MASREQSWINTTTLWREQYRKSPPSLTDLLRLLRLEWIVWDAASKPLHRYNHFLIYIYIFVYGELTQIQLPSVSFQAGVVLLLFQFCFRTETSSLKPVGEKGDTLPLTAHCCFSTAELTAKWVWCGAVPLLSASILPEALHQVWIGVLQSPPPPGPLLQPPHPALRSADEVWPEELQSLLGWGGRGINTVSSLLGRRIHCNSQTLILKKEEKKPGLESVLKISLIYSLTLENPPRSLVIARRWRQHGNIMLILCGDKGKWALVTGGIWILLESRKKLTGSLPLTTC